MNTIQNQKLPVGSRPTQLKAKIGPDTHQVLTLGNQKGWNFTLLGQAQLPKEPVHLDQWMIVPASQDSSEIPVRTYQRIQALFANGIRPKGFVVVHETPRLLSAPKIDQHNSSQERFPPERENPKVVSNPMDTVASIFSSTLLTTFLTILGTLFMGIAAIDPIVVAVMEDDSWVEIDRWATKV